VIARMESRSSAQSTVKPSRWAVAAMAGLLLACLAVPVAAKVAEPAAAPALKEKCLGCHDDPKVQSEAGKSVTVLADEFARSAHRKLDCAECHAAAADVKHPQNPLGPVQPQVCQDCHADEFKAIAGSIHGRRAQGDKAIKDCMGCHDSLHKVRKEGDPASTLSAVNQIKTCGACHEEMMANYERSEHAHALLKSGLVGSSPSCSSCHGKHDIRPKSDLTSTTSHARIPETCGTCHTGVMRDWRDSAHGAAWKAANGGKKGNEVPVCSTCHEPHAIKRLDTAVVRDQVADRCGDCHTKVDASFHDSFHGKASKLKNLKAAVCADCHTPHANLPASDPKSSIHPANLAKTCGASGCHQNVNASFLTFDPHASPTDPKRNFFVYLVWIGMTGLLLGVFGFFGLHDLLWLQRAVVGRLRGEWSAGHHKAGPYVRRFKSHQIWLHVSIVTSFLLLAATGLPLKYSEASWAPKLMAIFGSPEVAGVLHRFAAIVTFGYFAWHLGMLAYGWIVKKERGYFWGPRSMVPQPRDILDLWAMVKFFLYIGPRPKFDRFTYWEKFDYMGVFWGVAVIGISGLVLWMPTFFTTFFPGWVLNAAYVVHSDEALLATGFIFLFHFFHTHLRPEAFPLDPVVFTGRMPLEAFKEERPLEYARLVADGKLEERLTPAPTVVELRVAYIFGFAALAIGIVLAVFIFRALLGGLLH
jgi:cytochrome b subunit of formate dehydrogenase